MAASKGMNPINHCSRTLWVGLAAKLQVPVLSRAGRPYEGQLGTGPPAITEWKVFWRLGSSPAAHAACQNFVLGQSQPLSL